jgi:2,3-dihydroxybiphenyl 1,2-dioxygenase
MNSDDDNKTREETPSMMVKSLGYIGIHSVDLEGWRRFAGPLLGMQLVEDRAPWLALRMDEKRHRYLLQPSGKSGLAFAGFEVADAAALRRLASMLEQRGIRTQGGAKDEAGIRAVADFIWTTDPDGNRIEFFHGLEDADGPFVPGRSIGGFRTGELGMGHIVMLTPRFDEMSAYYRGALGFTLSDFHHKPFPAEFLHINPRHHSFALIGTDGPPAIHHLMCEYVHFDDVGRAYDMSLENPDSIGVSLGRHVNDHVTSFYARTPDRFLIEIGWAGRLIDDATWVAQELPSPSLWGHVRHWLPPERREHAREMTKAVGAKGIRAPVEVAPSQGFSKAPNKS